MKLIYFIIFVMGFANVGAFAASPRSVDAGEFDIAGIKLGMTPEEAIGAVTEKLQIGKSALEFDKFPKLNVVTSSREPEYFKAGLDGVSIIVHFEANVPYNPQRKMAVSKIGYEQPWSTDNKLAVKEMALKKYGQSSNGTQGVTLQWCLVPHKNPGLGCSEFKGPVLSLRGTKLELFDSRYRQAVIDFTNKSKSSKPVF